MSRTKRNILIVSVNVVTLFLLFVLRYSGLLVLNIGQAVPVTLIPFVAAIAFFFGEWVGFAVGFAAGTLMDSAVVGAACFNTLTLMAVGLICGLLSTYYLNKNFKTTLCLSFGSTVFYFLLRYFVFFLIKGIPVGGQALFTYAIPSIVYTTVLIIPFYFLEKALKNL